MGEIETDVEVVNGEKAIVVHEGEAQPTAVSPLDMPEEVFSAALERRKTNRSTLVEWVRSHLVENVDYGRIHIIGKKSCPYGKNCTNPKHFSKPSLFKPGAEKVCSILGLSPRFPTLNEYERAVLSGYELKQIIIRCELTNSSGRIIADGVGARSLSQDYGDLNKALKMAEKSAQVDATLRAAGMSEMFTQDIEDMSLGDPPAQKPPAKNPPKRNKEVLPVTSAQCRRLEARITEKARDYDIDREAFRERIKTACKNKWGAEHFKDLSMNAYKTIDDKLAGFAVIFKTENNIGEDEPSDIPM